MLLLVTGLCIVELHFLRCNIITQQKFIPSIAEAYRNMQKNKSIPFLEKKKTFDPKVAYKERFSGYNV
jgi:hypothetical protein